VKLWISATGCAEKAEVQQPSGVADLDAAAIAYALQAKYNPAGRDNQGIASTTVLPVVFKLRS
jgi:TonB family protein